MKAVPQEREAQLSQAMATIRDQAGQGRGHRAAHRHRRAPAEFRLHTTNAQRRGRGRANLTAQVIDDQGKTASLPVDEARRRRLSPGPAGQPGRHALTAR